MPKYVGAIAINPAAGATAVVTFTDPHGATPVAYSDRACTTPVALPATVSQRTLFHLNDDEGVYVISAKVGGLENADGNGGTVQANISDGGVFQVDANEVPGYRTYAPRSSQVAALRRELTAAERDVALLVLGDSTGDALDEWFYLTAQALGQAFPAYTVQHRLWSDTNQNYSAPVTIQTGAAGARVDGYASFDGTTGKYLSTPDSSALSITGDIDIRVKMDPTAYAPGGPNLRTLAAKYNFGGQRSWRFSMDPGGYLKLEWSADGTTLITPVGVGPLTGTPGTPQWVRVTLDVDNGAGGYALSFYKSPDGITWTQVGSTTTGGSTTSIFDSNYALEIGSRALGTADVFDGKVYRAEVRSGIDGTVVADLDLNSYVGSSTITDYAGNVWTVNGALTMVQKTGSPVLTAWNGSASGRSSSYHADPVRFPKVAPLGRPVLLTFISHSHNENTNTQYGPTIKTLTDLVEARYPAGGICMVAQNPRRAPAAYITEHAARIAQVIALAGRRRWDVVDAYSALNEDLTTYVNGTDGIHPTTAGSQRWATAVKQYLGIA